MPDDSILDWTSARGHALKEPAEQRESWDYLALVATIPPDVASQPLAEGGCPLVK